MATTDLIFGENKSGNLTSWQVFNDNALAYNTAYDTTGLLYPPHDAPDPWLAPWMPATQQVITIPNYVYIHTCLCCCHSCQSISFITLPSPKKTWRVEKNADQLILSLDVPGLKLDDVNLSIEDGVLHLTGTRFDTNEKIDETYAIDDEFDTSSVTAAFTHGVLTVSFKKRPECVSRKIKIDVL